MLRAKELQRLQESASNGLTETCSVRRSVVTIGAAGGQVAGAPTTRDNVKCRRIAARRPIEEERGGATPSVSLDDYLFAPGEDIAIGDEIIQGSNVWEVTGMMTRPPGLTIRVSCTKKQ